MNSCDVNSHFIATSRTPDTSLELKPQPNGRAVQSGWEGLFRWGGKGVCVDTSTAIVLAGLRMQ